MKISIIDYGAGNIQSVKFALERLGVSGIVTSDANEIISADKIIFPGVGEAGSAMQMLKEKKLENVITGLKQPVLGICLGMQLLCRHSEESDTACLGIFPVEVKRFRSENRENKIPHVGWNSVKDMTGDLFDGMNEAEHFYFVHSYYAEKSEYTAATCEYIFPFSASLVKNNFRAVQFHPEKSGDVGEKLLRNFLGGR